MIISTFYVKLAITVLNVILFLEAFVCLVVGIIMHVWLDELPKFLDAETIKLASTSMIVCGAFTLTCVVVGCIAMCTNSKYLIVPYIALLFVLIVVKVVLATYVLVHKNEFVQTIEDELTKLYTKETESIANGLPGSMKFPSVPTNLDEVQQSLNCCGLNGTKDFHEPIPLPKSCCPQHDLDGRLLTRMIEESSCKRVDAYKVGCLSSIGNLAGRIMNAMAFSLLVMALFEVLGLVCAVWLVIHIHKEQKQATNQVIDDSQN